MSAGANRIAAKYILIVRRTIEFASRMGRQHELRLQNLVSDKGLAPPDTRAMGLP